MKMARKLLGKTVQAWTLGENSSMETEMIARGLIRKTGEGQYALYSQEAVNGQGQQAFAGDYFKVDGAGYPYPNSREWFRANHRHISGDTWEQIPKALEIWEAGDGENEALCWLLETGKLTLREEEPERYFNAGILLMNLKAMRAFHFQQVFLELLDKVTFQVAQDQDYLNVICRDRVRYVGCEWNAMPNGAPVGQPQIIHYNVDCKPWHRDEVRYEAYFWDYANRSPCSVPSAQ